jgi:transposase
MGKIERIQVPPEDWERLERLVKDRNTPQKIVWRSRIVLLAGEGNGAVAVARRVGKSVLTVRRWRRRYAAKGVDGLLKDATRPPGRKPLTARKIKQVVNLTLNEKPPPTGANARWRRGLASHRRRCTRSGPRTGSSRI